MSENEDAHARYRRAFMGAFSERAVKEQAPLVERYVELMMRRFRAMVSSSRDGSATVDIVSWLNCVTFDVSSELSFGESFGSTEKGEPHPWVEISCRFGKGIALVASINYYAPLQKLLKYTMPRKVREKMVYHRELSTQKVRQRLQLQEERADFVQGVLRLQPGEGRESHFRRTRVEHGGVCLRGQRDDQYGDVGSIVQFAQDTGRFETSRLRGSICICSRGRH